MIGVQSYAQVTDSIIAGRKGAGLVITYRLKAGESVAMIANRYYASQEKIESLSMVDGRKKLPVGTTLYIPVSPENFTATKERSGIENKQELYFRVGEKDDLALVSMYAGVKKQDIVLWNNMRGNTLKQGQSVFIGWLKIVQRDSITMADGIAYPSRKGRVVNNDTGRHAFGELDSIYNVQTRNGTNVLNEKGTAVFFEKAGSNKIYFAFHNTTPRGAVIKVTNPGTGKTIYAKVLGPVPDTKQYANAVIGISNAAKEALGITEDRAWCELTYFPN
ncbi:hypothetical protein CJD36_001270 [Flavipsychrobacter stenotrophus]|uniref:LysM domain-containing protein n=1 Tax=Flavipsychrobacter stenotrophus TaxID=2077091 RepID=A0A2S7SZN2_9BACT|nr:hypothetical protein CJD36_001270 [Flavipsychrobacter stenotrophus]